MESSIDLQKQLSTLSELGSIVRTMKALSAASIHQYEQAVSALHAYRSNIEKGLFVVLNNTDYSRTNQMGTFKQPCNTRNAGLIIFGSDHGLCGRFNESLLEFAQKHVHSNYPDSNLQWISVGARATSNLQHAGIYPNKHFQLPSSTATISKTVQSILPSIYEWQNRDNIENVLLIFNRHSRGKNYNPAIESLLPVDLSPYLQLRLQDKVLKRWPSKTLPTYSQKTDELLRKLVHQILYIKVFQSCAESQASEHASRLAAMRSAQRSLEDKIDEVSQDYRHARQTMITAELLDVINGYKAITGDGF